VTDREANSGGFINNSQHSIEIRYSPLKSNESVECEANFSNRLTVTKSDTAPVPIFGNVGIHCVIRDAAKGSSNSGRCEAETSLFSDAH
jgi:hypothetical protein